MGSALLRGILRAQLYSPQEVGVSEPNLNLRRALSDEWGLRALSDNTVAAKAETVLLAVKPQVFPLVVEQVQPHIEADLVVSILAGISLAQLETAFPQAAVVRAMPNTPALVGAGMTALSFGGSVTEAQAARAQALFEAVGRTLAIPESQMDAVTALSGSGPGYMAVTIEALIDGGVRVGLPRAIATELAIQTMLGSAQLLQSENLHPAVLKDRVTSPGGTTIAGISVLEQRGFRSALMEAVRAAKERSRQLRESAS